MGDEPKLCYESTAIKLLNIPRSKFKLLELRPAKEVPNPHYRSGPPSRLYDRKTIEELAESPRVALLRPKPRNPVDYQSRFVQRYDTPENAFLDAAKAMFNLNRYAKHDCCSSANREEIYELKNQLIRLLYLRGYCQGAYRHKDTRPASECWSRAAPFSSPDMWTHGPYSKHYGES